MKRFLGVVIAAQLLGACAGKIIPPSAGTPPRVAATIPTPRIKPSTPVAPVPVTAPVGPTARSTGVIAGPDIASLKIDEKSARRALTAFQSSCPALLRRNDQSGLTTGADWEALCDEAGKWDPQNTRTFFEKGFEAVQVGPGTAFATGYYEPEIAGSRTQGPGYQVPVYARPKDIVDVDLGKFSDALKGKKIAGRVSGTSLVPYFERGEIDDGALAGKGLEIAWAADTVELFFLQVQGSGRLRLPDGGVMRIGYAGQNGRDYTGIGKLMKDRGLLEGRPTSMQGIMAYLREHPDEGRAIMRENKSWVFFRELTGAGPIGALGTAVTAQTSVAADPAFVPLGAPVFLSMDRADVTGLWVAQDTGGAIKGANRFDTFWGAGDVARVTAGGMSAHGTAFLLLPKGILARILADAPAQP